jgi:HD superfamily phosphohydrolase
MLKEFSDRIGLFLKQNLSDFKPDDRGPKVIHDPLWGSNLFHPWEIAIIDTPVFQRLRRIHQTGTAFFTYPSSSHSRFTHSLGVVVLANRLLRKLKDSAIEKKIDIKDKDIYEVRIAGLLHDVGHCFFSHTSEEVFRNLEHFQQIKSDLPQLKKKKVVPHEIFAYLMMTHETFIEFWTHIKKMFKSEEDTPDLLNIANMIIGEDGSPQRRFLREIITGPYDVDKLEYLYRDAYNAGLNLAYDIERFFYRITVEDTSKYSKVQGELRLVMDLSGVTAVEQLVFSKMMLFSYIYHHQKVRSADCLIRDIVRLLLLKTNPLVKIEHPCDFINYTDYDLLSCLMLNRGDKLSKLIGKLQNRELMKRCFVIVRDYVEGLNADQEIAGNYERLCGDMRDVIKGQMDLREKILSRINKESKKEYSLDDVYVDLPDLPSIQEAAKAPVKLPDGKIEAMSDYYQLEGWQKVYEIKKLRGYVFVKPEIASLANKVVRELLREEYNLNFDPLASQLAKINTEAV